MSCGRRTVYAAVGNNLFLGCFLIVGLVVFAGCVWIRHRTSQNVKRAEWEEQLPLTEKVKFEAKLQRGNRVQVPKMVRWRFKLESYQIIEVTVNLLGIWTISPRNFLTRMSKDGRIVIPKKTLYLLRQDRPNLEGFMMAVTLAPS